MLTQKEMLVLDYLISQHNSDSSITLKLSDEIFETLGKELDLVLNSLYSKKYITLKKNILGDRIVSLTYNGLSYKEQEQMNSSPYSLLCTHVYTVTMFLLYSDDAADSISNCNTKVVAHRSGQNAHQKTGCNHSFPLCT